MNPNYGPCRSCTSSVSFCTLLSPFLVCVFPIQGHSAGAGMMKAKGGVCSHGWEPSCAWYSINTWSAGISSLLTPLAHCPCLLVRGCASPLGRRWLRGGGSKAQLVPWWKWVLAGLEEASKEAQWQARSGACKCSSEVWVLFSSCLARVTW